MGTRFKLDPQLETEINALISIQEPIINIDESNFEEILQIILNSVFISTPEKLNQLVKIILVAVEYRPFKIPLIADLCLNLSNNESSENELSQLKPQLLFKIFSSTISSYIKPEELYFMTVCLENGFFSSQDIVASIDQYIRDNPEENFGLIKFIPWFGPEIDSTRKDLLNILGDVYDPDDHDEDEIPPEVDSIIQKIQNREEIDWKYVRKSRINGCGESEINKIIKNDDIDSLQKLASDPTFDFDSFLGHSIYEVSNFCSTDLTILQLSAFYSAIKCFKFLILNEASIDINDSEGKTTAQFAVAGGCNEIIRVLEQRKCSFEGTLEIAALHHRQSVFWWLYDTYYPILTESEEKPNLILTQCASSNNLKILLYCLEKGFNVNQKNQMGVCFSFIGLHY